jgi:DNA-binding MarR family transcriptional regulator
MSSYLMPKYWPGRIAAMRDLVDQLLAGWAEQRPELDCSALGVVVRIQLLGKLLGESAEEALVEFGLKLWEYDVLSALRRQGEPYELPASDLARDSMLTSGTITTRIDGLQKRGLVERRPGQTDRRVVRIRLTQAGLDAVDAALQARLARADEQLKSLPNKERQALSSALRKILVKTAAEPRAA